MQADLKCFFLWPPLKFSPRFVVAVFDWYSRLMHLTEQQGTNCYENNTKENLTFRFFVMDVWSSDTYYDGIWDPSLEFHQFFFFSTISYFVQHFKPSCRFSMLLLLSKSRFGSQVWKDKGFRQNKMAIMRLFAKQKGKYFQIHKQNN